MKKLICAVLALVMAFSLVGCGLFSDSTIVKFTDSFTHKDPEGLKYDQRLAMRNESFDITMEEIASSAAYPDIMMYGEDGSMVGMYNYDPSTGLAAGYTDLATGEYTAFPAGEEVELGMPDESLLVELVGAVTLGFVVYSNEGAAQCAYVYFLLSDPADKEIVREQAQNFFTCELTDAGDNVLSGILDADYIAADFELNETYYGQSFETKDAAAYGEILSMSFGVREFGKANPYKPYEGHTDPEGLDFDKRSVLTGSGEYAVVDPYYKDMKCLTDYIYGKDGKVVAHYSYYEFGTKETVDEMMKTPDNYFNNAVRISDTVIQASLSGDELADTITAYIGYSVLKSDSFDEYVKMVCESFLSEIAE